MWGILLIYYTLLASAGTSAFNQTASTSPSIEVSSIYWNSVTFSWTKLSAIFLTAHFTCAQKVSNSTSLDVNATYVTYANLPVNETTSISCNFTLSIHNRDGTSNTSTINITTPFIDIPSEPRNFTSRSVEGWEDSRALLKWNIPEDLGHSKAEEISYELQWCLNKTSNEDNVINRPTECADMTIKGNNSVTLSDLRNGSFYAIVIRALNTFKRSSGSTRQSLQTAVECAVPSEPLNVVATQTEVSSDERIFVEWSHSKLLPGLNYETVKYIIEYCHLLVCVTVKSKPGETEIILENMKEDTWYNITVMAVSVQDKLGKRSVTVLQRTTEKDLETWKVIVVVAVCLFTVIIATAFVAKWHFYSKSSSNFNVKNVYRVSLSP